MTPDQLAPPRTPLMLILFDIDATLLRTEGAGVRAMVEAGRELFGPRFSAEGVEVSGRLDTLIIPDMLRRAGAPPTPANVAAVRREYARRLEADLSRPGVRTALPGVLDLLAALVARGPALGLLTGNFEETGSIKLRAYGIDPSRFHVNVWADDSPHDPPSRDHLPPVAFDRYRSRFGRPVAPQSVTIIGDTPHDVRCAKIHGCRSLAVATGKFSQEVLAAAGADRTVPDLSSTDDLARWLIGD